ncbi:MAG: sulfite exporter TauE/SafE family protein, partial [Synergistes sp.]|nr:sulfite exporter TauE/SafE family protein [Synergistes sp.]
MYLWFIAAVTAYFIKGLCGFANTLVFTSILSFGASNASISPIDLLLGYPSNLILTWENRKNLDRKIWLPLAALVLAGSIPGAFMLKNVDVRAIKIVFGAAVIAIGTEMLLRDNSRKRAGSSKLLLAVIGVTAGVLCGLFGVGALLAACVSR